MVYALYSTLCLALRGSSNGAQWEAYVLPWKDNIQDNTLLMPTPPHAPAPSHAYTFTQTEIHTHTHTTRHAQPIPHCHVTPLQNHTRLWKLAQLFWKVIGKI